MKAATRISWQKSAPWLVLAMLSVFILGTRLAGELLEHAHVFGRDWYGTPRGWVEERMGEGKVVILEIEVQGAAQTADCGLPRYSVLVHPPSWDVLEARLRGRETDSAEAIAARLATAREELAAAPAFDAQVVNNDLERVVAEIRELVAARLAGEDTA